MSRQPTLFRPTLGLSLCLGLLALATSVACGPQNPDTPEAPGAQDTQSVQGATPGSASAAGTEADGKKAWVVAPAPDLPADRPLIAGFVVVDGVYNTELAGPWDIFQHSVYQIQPGIRPVAISPDGGPITTAEGLVLTPDHGFVDAPPLDILVVPSAENSRGSDLENEALVAFIAERGENARYVVSLCWGAFVLAQAGVLDGHAATTFPPDQPALAEAFPAVDVHLGMSFVHDGPALTSQGGIESYTAAMYLLDHLYGPEVASGVGSGLLIPWPPQPGTVPAVVVSPQP